MLHWQYTVCSSPQTLCTLVIHAMFNISDKLCSSENLHSKHQSAITIVPRNIKPFKYPKLRGTIFISLYEHI